MTVNVGEKKEDPDKICSKDFILPGSNTLSSVGTTASIRSNSWTKEKPQRWSRNKRTCCLVMMTCLLIALTASTITLAVFLQHYRMKLNECQMPIDHVFEEEKPEPPFPIVNMGEIAICLKTCIREAEHDVDSNCMIREFNIRHWEVRQFAVRKPMRRPLRKPIGFYRLGRR